MGKQNIPGERLANVYDDQEAHIIALRMLFSTADSQLEGQEPSVESLRLLNALQEHIALRLAALDLLAMQIAQLRQLAKRQHALRRDLYLASWEDTRFTSSGPRAGVLVAAGSGEDSAARR